MENGIRNRLMANTKDIRIFAVGIGVIFQVFALASWWKGGMVSPYLAGFGAIFTVFGLALPSLMAPFYRHWIYFSTALGRIQTLLFLTIFFFLALTPLAVFLRIMRRDMLCLSFKPGKESYWKKRPPLQANTNYEKQF